MYSFEFLPFTAYLNFEDELHEFWNLVLWRAVAPSPYLPFSPYHFLLYNNTASPICSSCQSVVLALTTPDITSSLVNTVPVPYAIADILIMSSLKNLQPCKISLPNKSDGSLYMFRLSSLHSLFMEDMVIDVWGPAVVESSVILVTSWPLLVLIQGSHGCILYGYTSDALFEQFKFMAELQNGKSLKSVQIDQGQVESSETSPLGFLGWVSPVDLSPYPSSEWSIETDFTLLMPNYHVCFRIMLSQLSPSYQTTSCSILDNQIP